MGSEILYPIGIVAKWAVLSFSSLIAVYLLLMFPLRHRRPQWLGIALRTIFIPYVVLLSIPTLFCIVLTPIFVVTAFNPENQPRFAGPIGALVLDTFFAAIWWGGTVLFRGLEKLSQSGGVLPEIEIGPEN